MKLLTVFITHNRLELTKQAIQSYVETVTVPHRIWVADNASIDGTQEWIREAFEARLINGSILYPENHYAGFACNHAWSALSDETHLHRADNDFAFLPGWCDEVQRKFRHGAKLGQLGLRTNEEELSNRNNVGGNCVIKRELWEKGLRYDERPWPQIAVEVGRGWSEDSLLSPAVKKMGYQWSRVRVPCIRSLASGDMSDEYYIRSYGDRGIVT
jgi:glycosyltransferase involved in cell wall biosynthesis